MTDSQGDMGFSVELSSALAEALSWDGYDIERKELYSDMLNAVRDWSADLAIANISITATHETEMDFSQPIFESGLQIMVPADSAATIAILHTLASPDLTIAIRVAFVLLLGDGTIMWAFERRAQLYFNRSAREAWFPSFCWAFNLVVNGGFEERVPRTLFGKVFGVVLVASSLFIVSVSVAKITAVMTVDAITGSMNSVNDLYGQRVATIENSTAAGFLDRRELDYETYADLDAPICASEAGETDAVVFDAPVLS